MEIIPVNFGLKYKPPKLGMQYHIINQPAAHFVHEISLSFVTKYSDIDDVTDELFARNNEFLNPRVISHNQVRRLVERLISHLRQTDAAANKENKTSPLISQKAPTTLFGAFPTAAPGISYENVKQPFDMMNQQEAGKSTKTNAGTNIFSNLDNQQSAQK